ncbi:hypothetical protein OCJ37_05780 [Xanthomonas sp. AM6]|uniref:hypothetical protein n=1 Tax=Xanthomonas sp. AM6 TaxID=2982531 RepID=UPI0021D83931|nr:hypothetical protein [Xanthomonas sp. AM6]UYB53455.1 hypothetical protein OCJ37_05780 [Xanthomonas sp. AM6]
MEWINDGQLVQKYAVEVFRDGARVKMAEAQAVRRMMIDHFQAVTDSRVRLNTCQAPMPRISASSSRSTWALPRRAGTRRLRHAQLRPGIWTLLFCMVMALV